MSEAEAVTYLDLRIPMTRRVAERVDVDAVRKAALRAVEESMERHAALHGEVADSIRDA